VEKKEKDECKVYFLCLIGWPCLLEATDLGDLKKFFKENHPSLGDVEEKEKYGNCDWIVRKFKQDENQVKNRGIWKIISDAKVGYYHSRIIFEFNLKKNSSIDLISPPTRMVQFRKIRKGLSELIKSFLKGKLITKIGEIIYSNDIQCKKPHIFIYPIFELKKTSKRKTYFKISKGKEPFSLASTCFYTKLDDRLRLRDVKMRLSGAQIITTKMSKWFFNKLINITFHEGLYRQRSDRELKNKNSSNDIYFGMENRLEDFAQNLLTIFHQYSSDLNRRKNQWFALIMTIVGICAGILYFVFNYLLSKGII